mmetsp:Transcript_9764/g.19896  ORF Transcript_9764/g.19896 Transcript_9764/m.19896 type:complete len:87 (-) Transcript_9764:576-836(-)
MGLNITNRWAVVLAMKDLRSTLDTRGVNLWCWRRILPAITIYGDATTASVDSRAEIMFAGTSKPFIQSLSGLSAIIAVDEPAQSTI